MHLVCLDGWCELVAGSLSQLQHSTGKTGLPLKQGVVGHLRCKLFCVKNK